MMYSLQMYIDTHCHLDFEVFDATRDELMSACLQQGVSAFLVPSTTRLSWDKVATLAALYPSWRVAFGLHPYFLATAKDEDLALLGDYCEQKRAVALGEIGLDYWPGAIDIVTQQRFFESQLHIATCVNLPVIVHARKSYDQVLKTLRKTNFSCGGIIHAFNGSLEQAQRLIDYGFVLGIGGTVTYPRAKKAHRVLQGLSAQAFVLETDSPDMPLYGFQGETNTPLSVVSVAQSVASLREESVTTVAQQAKNNLLSVFPKWYED